MSVYEYLKKKEKMADVRPGQGSTWLPGLGIDKVVFTASISYCWYQ